MHCSEANTHIFGLSLTCLLLFSHYSFPIFKSWFFFLHISFFIYLNFVIKNNIQFQIPFLSLEHSVFCLVRAYFYTFIWIFTTLINAFCFLLSYVICFSLHYQLLTILYFFLFYFVKKFFCFLKCPASTMMYNLHACCKHLNHPLVYFFQILVFLYFLTSSSSFNKTFPTYFRVKVSFNS